MYCLFESQRAMPVNLARWDSDNNRTEYRGDAKEVDSNSNYLLQDRYDFKPNSLSRIKAFCECVPILESTFDS